MFDLLSTKVLSVGETGRKERMKNESKESGVE